MSFYKKVNTLFTEHEKLVSRKNVKEKGNGVYCRY